MALVIICELIESKYGIKIDPRTQVKLKKKKMMGELGPQQVRKKPRKVYAEDGYLGNEEMPSNIVDVVRGNSLIRSLGSIQWMF